MPKATNAPAVSVWPTAVGTVITDRRPLSQKRTLRLHPVRRNARRDTKAIFIRNEAAAHATFLLRAEIDRTATNLVLLQKK